MVKLIFILSFLSFVVLCSCKNADKTSTTKTITASVNTSACNSPQRITAIYKEYVYDLSGYEVVGGSSAYNLFDENDYVEPKNPSYTYRPTVSPHPFNTREMYFKDGGGRIVVDLQIPYRLQEIYLFDRARTTDSVWVYTGTMRNWKLKAAFTTKGDIGLWGWRRFAVDDSTRYVMFRFSSYEADITEAVLYGCALGTPPSAPSKDYTGPRLVPKTLREFLGVNTSQGQPIDLVKPFYNTRLYTFNWDIDNDTIHSYPSMKFNIVPHGWWNNGTQSYVMYADSIVRFNGNKIWYSYLGIPTHLAKYGYNVYDRPVNKPGMNTEDPSSYSRHASMFWNLAAVYGRTTVDTNLIQAWNPVKFSGSGIMTQFENGNESDGFWLGYKYCSPTEYYAQSTADYDGDHGRLGPRHGIKNADPNSELIMAGIAGVDTNRVRVLKFLCNTMREDGRFLWTGGIQYHYYSSNGKGQYAGTITSTATAGITPEEDSLRVKMKKIRDYTYRIEPNVEVIMGEYGYDKSRKSIVSAPMVPGYNQAQSQGIMLLRGINAFSFSGFDRLILYWLQDNEEENHEAYFITSGLIRKLSENSFLRYPAWYYISTMLNHIGSYTPEAITSEKGNVWIYKYRNKQSPDSVAYFVYCPSRNGTKVNDYLLDVGKVSGNATEISFKENSEAGNSIEKQIQGGKIKMEVTEFPKIILFKEN